jgi:hypothetical protein
MALSCTKIIYLKIYQSYFPKRGILQLIYTKPNCHEKKCKRKIKQNGDTKINYYMTEINLVKSRRFIFT